MRSAQETASFDRWMAALEARQLGDLRFPEVTRALRALSSAYVERRGGLAHGAALSGAGKRAAFALYYGPLHYLLVRSVIDAVSGATSGSGTLVDVGCGTGSAGAAWASACARPLSIVGVDRHPWALAEAAWSYRTWGLTARTRRVDLGRDPLPRGDAYLAAFTMNELSDAARSQVMETLLERHRHGAAALIIEPIAGFVAPWWSARLPDVLAAGGRADEWRFDVEPPALVRKLADAAGLSLRALTGRSIWLPGRPDGARTGAAMRKW